MKKLLIVAALMPLLAIADSKISSKDSMDCELKYRTQSDIVSCLLKKQGDSKKSLASAYTNATKKANGDSALQSRLEKSQQSWISQRNEQCKLEADIYGREADKYLIEQTCLNYLNKQRAAYLNSIDSVM